jgi:hypothetical protein
MVQVLERSKGAGSGVSTLARVGSRILNQRPFQVGQLLPGSQGASAFPVTGETQANPRSFDGCLRGSDLRSNVIVRNGFDRTRAFGFRAEGRGEDSVELFACAFAVRTFD